jgi:hypothetical protein
MRKLKGSQNYLRNQTWKNLSKAILCLILFDAVFLTAIGRLLFYLRIGLLEELLLVVSPLPLAASYYFLHRHHVYKGGWEGEKQVTKLLSSTLSDDYYLMNGVHFRGGGDIDHIVLGLNGVFAVETKNWRGTISCDGDTWQRRGKRITSSPSEQAKKNAARIRRVLEASGKVPFSVWVEAIVVFTNNHVDLHTCNSTVPILRLHQLTNYIITLKNRNHTYTTQQLQQIAKEITNQT